MAVKKQVSKTKPAPKKQPVKSIKQLSKTTIKKIDDEDRVPPSEDVQPGYPSDNVVVKEEKTGNHTVAIVVAVVILIVVALIIFL